MALLVFSINFIKKDRIKFFLIKFVANNIFIYLLTSQQIRVPILIV
ncbi:hypothetical protein FLA105534_00302 [Flavobacterium bizetiae]|uniref:Uncharacterized protein n=1 Tax=Flavobacterium bizetiae TaxID=2704140 RepID=A0A6J4G6X2_9FLAO|nr:hypothetical protein FLA105534_00302 [Flavobacterium bizetiae]CAD5340672.1 hypothetical protein FLA105535_00627 [Flavobacterium bizetiae]CAD5346307.1 hypothetical protein FLA105534_00248 [Flavobacterium bizetiae]